MLTSRTSSDSLPSVQRGRRATREEGANARRQRMNPETAASKGHRASKPATASKPQGRGHAEQTAEATRRRSELEGLRGRRPARHRCRER